MAKDRMVEVPAGTLRDLLDLSRTAEDHIRQNDPTPAGYTNALADALHGARDDLMVSARQAVQPE
jgi:hypothetical protein